MGRSASQLRLEELNDYPYSTNYINDFMKTQRILQLASVASMIDLFNKDNILILEDLGAQIDVAANFQEGSITSYERVNEYHHELTDRGIEVIDYPCPRSLFRVGDIIRSYKIIKNLVEGRCYKIVHCHSPIGGVIARLACRKVRKKGTKVVYTAHGFHFFKGTPLLNWVIFYPIEKLCSRITDVLITINQEDFKRAKDWNTCRVELVPGIGVHTEEFRKGNVDRINLRKQFGFDGDDFVFMSTGQLSVRKNHEVIIRAIAKIQNPKVKYLIVGFGELEDKHKALVKELGVENRVAFAGYRGDVKQLLHAVDAYAFPSLQEGLPVALMEAMSVGLPIVCSKIRGNVDLIENHRGGFLYNCHDSEGFADGMQKIVSGEVEEMGRVNIETMKKFDTEAVNSQMRNLYGELLNS